VLNVIAPAATVSGAGDQPGYLVGYGVIDADLVREMSEGAARRLVDCPQVSAAAAVNYQPSAALARWIRCRDLTCRFPGCDRPAEGCDIDHTIPFNHADPAAGGLTVPWNLACYCREHHRLKTFHSGPHGWRDEQLADGTIVWTSPTGRIYRTTPGGTELFQLRGPCRAPTPRTRHRAKDKAARIARTRTDLAAQRPVNAENRRVNRARRREVADRKWRNRSRDLLFILKGKPSTSPFARWINDPYEPEQLPPDWQPPPPPTPSPDDEPPF
jgi:hypothetical protein